MGKLMDYESAKDFVNKVYDIWLTGGDLSHECADWDSAGKALETSEGVENRSGDFFGEEVYGGVIDIR